MVLLIFFTAHVFFLRPYRSLTTNVIYGMCMIAICVQVLFLYAKVSGYQQSIFVDKYFFTLLLLLNGFCWFLVFTAVVFTLTSGQKWPITAEEV